MDKFLTTLAATVSAQYQMKGIYDCFDKSVQFLCLLIVRKSFSLHLSPRENRQLHRLIKKMKDITSIRPVDASVLSEASLIIQQIMYIRHDLID